jgi:hypothetical protein
MQTGEGGTGGFQANATGLVMEIGLAGHPGCQIPQSAGVCDPSRVLISARDGGYEVQAQAAGSLHELVNPVQTLRCRIRGRPDAQAVYPGRSFYAPEPRTAEAATIAQRDRMYPVRQAASGIGAYEAAENFAGGQIKRVYAWV